MSVSEETNEIENAKQDKPKEKSSFPRTMKKPLYVLDEDDYPSQGKIPYNPYIYYACALLFSNKMAYSLRY